MPPRGTVADHRLRDFLTRVDQPYEWFEKEAAPDLLERHGVAGAELPVVVVDGEIVLVQPALEELADSLGIRYAPKATGGLRRGARLRPGRKPRTGSGSPYAGGRRFDPFALIR